MWLAHHFPGLSSHIDRLLCGDEVELTPEETQALIRAGDRTLNTNSDERWGHTKAIAMAAGMRLR